MACRTGIRCRRLGSCIYHCEDEEMNGGEIVEVC